MFLHLSVSHSAHRGGVSQHAMGVSASGSGGGCTPPRQTHPLGRHPPPRQIPRGSIRSRAELPPPLHRDGHFSGADTHYTGMHSCGRLNFSTPKPVTPYQYL